MIPAMINGSTRIVGGKGIGKLPIRDVVEDGTVYMVSAWEPTPDEQIAIAAGAKIEISIMGGHHPPIIVRVGPTPE